MLEAREWRLSRREMFHLAGLSLTSASGWFPWLIQQAQASGSRLPKACILIWQGGGGSQIDTFDMKPGTPNAGEFKPIATTVPGIQICEHLPKLAQLMRHMVLLRSMSTTEGEHSRARFHLHTGYRRGTGGVVHPPLGSIVAKKLGKPDFSLPEYIYIGSGPYSAGFLGSQYAPLVVQSPARGVQNLDPNPFLGRPTERMQLLETADREFAQNSLVQGPQDHLTTLERSIRLLRSDKAAALDISRESASVRSRYGESFMGQSCLLARRLVEVGVSFVEINKGGWDNHTQIFENLKNSLLPDLDNGMSALLTDLRDKGLLESTLVICMGEFGRTPGINSRGPTPGRDHYPRAWTSVLAGGGLKTGQVLGRTSATGATVEERPITPPDFLATLCQVLGIDPTRENTTREGRPIRIVDRGERIIQELF